MTSQLDHYDIAIIGGGLAGLTLASLLAQNSAIKIAIIDRYSIYPNPDRRDYRTTAISYGSRKILETAKIWDHLQEPPCPIQDIQILDGASPLLLNFLSAEVEGKDFGWIVDNFDLRRAMVKRLKASNSVTFFENQNLSTKNLRYAKAKGSRQADQICIALEGKEIKTNLLIGADGRNSMVRDWMEVEVRAWPYKQRAIICNIAHENPHQNIAVEHFWPEGPFAILPMSDLDGRHRSSIVFTEHGSKAQSWQKMSDDVFAAALTRRIPERYGKVTVIGPRLSYPLGLVHAGRYISSRAALIADAAHGIHPIAGQGLNLGFRDVDYLANLVLEGLELDHDIGRDDLLQKYEKARRKDNVAMIAATDSLNRLFSNNILPIRLARKIGLRAVSRFKPAKDFFMREAMGDRSS